MKHCYLRKVKFEDTELLYEWVNNEEVRRNSFDMKKVIFEEHINWLKSKLHSATCDFFIYMEDEIPIGHIRLDYVGEGAVISYSIDYRYRGNGYGVRMLKQLEEELICLNKYDLVLIGKVKSSNKASLKIFRKLGYDKIEDEEVIKFTKQIRKEIML